MYVRNVNLQGGSQAKSYDLKERTLRGDAPAEKPENTSLFNFMSLVYLAGAAYAAYLIFKKG